MSNLSETHLTVPTPALPVSDANDWAPLVIMETISPSAPGLTRVRLANEGDAPIDVRVMHGPAIDRGDSTDVTHEPSFDLLTSTLVTGAEHTAAAKSWIEFTVAVEDNYYRIDVRRDDAYAGNKPTFAVLDISTPDTSVRTFPY